MTNPYQPPEAAACDLPADRWWDLLLNVLFVTAFGPPGLYFVRRQVRVRFGQDPRLTTARQREVAYMTYGYAWFFCACLWWFLLTLFSLRVGTPLHVTAFVLTWALLIYRPAAAAAGKEKC